MSENDPTNLSLYEAFYIRKHNPILNSRKERREFVDFLFRNCINILETIFMHFKRPLPRVTRSSRPLYFTHFFFYFYNFVYILYIIFTLLHILPYIYFDVMYSSMRNNFSSLMMPLTGKSLDYNVLFVILNFI